MTTVTGSGSQWNNSGNLFVGLFGTGTLNVEGGGVVSNTVGYIGNQAGSTGVATVTGSGSRWNNSSSLSVGDRGNGTLNVEGGGVVAAASGITIASQAGSSGTLNIGRFGTNDTGGTIIAPTIEFGAGTGAINFNQSDAVTVTSAISGAGTLNQLGAGTLTLSGANTYSGGTLVSSGELAGDTTSLQGTMTNNALVTFSQTTNGTYAGAMSGAGALTKTGAGTLTLSGINTYSGHTSVNGGTLNISGGSQLSNARGYIGRYTNSTGVATVTGSGSQWNNSGFLVVGDSGNGTLNVEGGGVVSNTVGYIGNQAGSTGVATVTGSGSQWNNSGNLFVGLFGTGTLNVADGGVVSNTVGYIGNQAGSTGVATVTGSGSQWNNSGFLFVGLFGTGTLNVADGGVVAAASGITIASQAGSSGTLNIGRLGQSDTGGAISTPTITFGNGTGAINFNQSDAVTITSVISGAGTLNQLGAGTTTLSGTNTYSGDTTISGGTLRLANENAAGSGRIIQTALTSLVEFLGAGRMTNEMSVFQYSFDENFEAAGQLTLADAASSIAVASGATVTGSGSFVGAGGLTKKGLGTLSLTAGNSFSGPLSVEAGTLALAASGSSAAGSVTSVGVSSGATLLVSQNNQVNNGASVTLSGGTIRTASGVSEVFGNLNLTQASFLDFGTTSYANANTISFGTYTYNTTPSALLTINNFNFGSTLTFGSNLSTTDLATFSFTNGGIASSSWNEGTSTFTITAIPEPSTYVAAIALLALMLWPLRHRLRGRIQR